MVIFHTLVVQWLRQGNLAVLTIDRKRTLRIAADDGVSNGSVLTLISICRPETRVNKLDEKTVNVNDTSRRISTTHFTVAIF